MLPVLYQGFPTTHRSVNRLANLFDRMFNNDDWFAPLTTSPAWSAAPLSLRADENNVYAEIDLPGVTEKDIELFVHDGDLIVRGERKSEQKQNGYDARSYGQFEQRVTLPVSVDADKVEATLANGVLSITLPRSEDAKPRRIAVKTE